jgi:hypothetical protein
MDKNFAMRLVQTLIDYFETGTKETDRTAKNIIEWDAENRADWQAEMQRLHEAGDWTGLRAPEADIIAAALRLIQRQLA